MNRKSGTSLTRSLIFSHFATAVLPMVGIGVGIALAGQEFSHQLLALVEDHFPLLATSFSLSLFLVVIISIWRARSLTSPLRKLLVGLEESRNSSQLKIPSLDGSDDLLSLSQLCRELWQEKESLQKRYENSLQKIRSHFKNVNEEFHNLESRLAESEKGDEEKKGKSSEGDYESSRTNSILDLEEAFAELRDCQRHVREVLEKTNQLREESEKHQQNLEKFIGEWKEIRFFQEEMEEGLSKLHLLFLNSSIEAARLGEDGRGVEVMAGELQGLVERLEDAYEEVHPSFSEAREKLEYLSHLGNKLEDFLRSLDFQIRETIKVGETFRDRGRIFLEKHLLTPPSASLPASANGDEKAWKEEIQLRSQELRQALGNLAQSVHDPSEEGQFHL